MQKKSPGDRRKIVQPEHAAFSKEQEPLTGKPVWGTNGEKRREVGDKCKIMLAEHPESSGTQVGDEGKEVEDKGKIMRAEHPLSSGGQAETSWRQM